MEELEQDIDFSSAIVGAQKPAPVKKKVQPQVASSTTLDSKSVSQPTKSLSGSQLKEDKEEIGMIDDLWNTLKGAGVKTLANIASIPAFAQNAALDIVASATGRSSEFNKLPSSVKKQIRNSLSATTPMGQMAETSQEATDFLNKKSEDIYKKTRQQELSAIDELIKFKNNPNAESVKNILYQGLKTTVESLPAIASYSINPALLGVSVAAGKRSDDITESKGNVGIGDLINAGIYGVVEQKTEGITRGIIGKAIGNAVGSPTAARAIAEGVVTSVVKDMGLEGLSEGATTLIQETSDKITKGEEINISDILKKSANSAVLGLVGSGGVSLAGEGVGAARRYVASKIIPKEQRDKLNNNLNTIQSLNLEHGDDVDPRVNKIVNKKIDELVAENEAIMAENEAIAANLSADQVKQIFDIDDKLEENFNSAKSIIDDASMDKSAKELLLDDLLKQQNNLKQQKDAVQKQTTSEVPIQPEAGVSGEVAEGEPQAEPQVPTEEGKAEEIERRRQEELAPYASQTTVSEETFEGLDLEGNPVVYLVRTMADGSRQVRLQLTIDGKLTNMPIGKAGKDITFSNAELIEKSYASEPKSISINNNPSNPKKINAINAKYDAELAALPTQEVKAEEVKPEPGSMIQMATEEVTPTETIEVFHGGNLPSLEEGKPLYVSENSTQANEYAKMSDGEVSKFFLDKGKIADEADAYSIMEELGLPTDANFFELIDPRFEEALPEEDIKKVFDALKERGFEAVRYTDIDQKTLKPGIKNILVIDASKSLKTEPIVEEQVKPTEETQVNAVQKGIDAVNKALQRGRPRKEAVQGGIAYMQQTVAYEKADDVTREQMLRDINKEFGVKEKKAPSAKKVLGETTQKKVTVNEMTALKDQIKLEAKAAKGAEKATDQVRKDVVEKIKSMITRGALSKPQQKSLLNSLAKTNILNPVMRERLFERMDKMFKRADYQDRIKEATTFRNRIKKLAKSDTLQASVAKMAKDFAKVIPEFTDIDTYLENARQVYDAIKKPIRKAASIEAVSTFTADELAKQEEKVKNTLLDQYDYLAEAGLIDASMSLAEIQNYVMSVEAGTAPDTIENEAEIRGNIKELFNSMTDIADYILEDGFNPLTNEELELDAYTKKLLKNFTSMDLDLMSIRDSYRAAEALENYIVNDIVDNMETMYQNYIGAEKAKSFEDKGVVAQSFRRVFGSKPINYLSRIWTSAFSPVKSILDLVHRSRKVGSEVFDAMGLRGISNANSQANAIVDRIEEAYSTKFQKTKPNGKNFNDIENVFERQTYASLKRSVNGTQEQKQDEFTRRKKIVEESIQELLNSKDSKLVKKGKIENAIYDKIRDASSPEQVGELIDPKNKEAVDFWINTYKKFYPEVKQIASSVYNTVLEDDIDYTPDIFEQIVEKEVGDVGESSLYKMAFDFLNQKPSGTLMKNNRIKSLPKGRVLSFDFDYNNSVALRKMLVDIKTAPYVQQYRGFTQSPSFDKIYPDPKDRVVIKDRLNYYVNEVRSKNVATGSVDAKKFAKVVQAVSRYGTSRALGSVTSFIKQGGTALTNTLINLADDPASTIQGFRLLKNKDATKFLENSGYGIANRGLESQTAIESANKVIDQVDLGSSTKVGELVNKSSELIGKAGKIYLDNFLKQGDVIAARASWFAYYLHDLKKQGVNTSNLDWKNHELNKKAADYAEDQVNLQQNVSDSDMMGKFLTTKNPWTTITRSMILPFSSFIFNAKDKITTDITILTSKASSDQDKVDAIKSLSATAAEMVLFEAMAATINSWIMIVANSILGIDEDEEEKEKRRDKYIKSATTKFATDVLSPIPNIGDTAVVALINSLADLVQSDLPEEERAKLYEYKPQSSWDALLSFVGGVPEIAVRPFIDMSDTINMITSDSYTDRFGNEIELSYEDKSKLVYVLAVELLASTNLLPTEAVRINEKVKQQIEKEAR